MKSNPTRKENSQPTLAFLQNLLGSNEEGHERAHEGGAECANDGTDDKPGMLMSREELLMKMETWELVIAKYYEYWI